jgi:flagellar motility protein MotE (MotC chaperone)
MIRILGLTIAIFCTATLFTLAGATLWIGMQGHINREDLAEMKAIVMGTERPSQMKVVQEDETPRKAGFEEISRMRVLKIMELEKREQELDSLKQNIDLQVQAILVKRTELETLRDAMRKEIDTSEKKISAEATEQARGILLKMSPDAAVEKLMTLETPEAITLVKGMGEKDAAKILDKFRGGEAGAKGNEIFAAISRGFPQMSAVNGAKNQMGANGQGN